MGFVGFKILFPRTDFIALVAIFVLIDQAAADLGELCFLVVDRRRIRFEIRDDVLHHEFVLYGVELKGNLLRVAERVGHFDRLCGVIGRRITEATPISGNLFEQLGALIGIAFAMEFNDLFQSLHRLYILPAIEKNLDKLITCLRVVVVLSRTHQSTQSGDKAVIFAEGETLHPVSEPGDGFLFLQGRGLEDAVALLHIRLAPPTVGCEGVHIVMILAKQEPAQRFTGTFVRIDSHNLTHRPTPPLAIRSGGFP